MKKLSKKQLEKQAKRQLKELLKETEKKLFKNVESSLMCGAIPEHWSEKDSYYLSRAIMDSFCIDRPYKFLSKDERKNTENLNRFL